MSLRTSAHTGAAIRVPAEKLCKLAILRANLWRFSDSPKVLLFVLLYCEENGLPRRSAPRNDSGGRPLHPLTPGKFLRTLRTKRPCPAHACQVSACPRAKCPCTRRRSPSSVCHREPRPCTRAHLPVFSMSLRTSAHTGAAIRFPRSNAWQVSST